MTVRVRIPLFAVLLLLCACRSVFLFSCPLECDPIRHCENSEEELKDICEGDPVYKACHCCHECPKLKNESCGGSYGHHGICAKEMGLVCAAKSDTLPFPQVDEYDKSNVTGRCMQDACTKNCSTRGSNIKCGSDGRWYQNPCFLRQKNCPQSNNYQERIKIMKNNDVCNSACREPLLDHGSVSFTKGLRKESRATFTCDAGYELIGPSSAICSSNQLWTNCSSRQSCSPHQLLRQTIPHCLSVCDNKVCGSGEKCIVTEGSSTATCICKEESDCINGVLSVARRTQCENEVKACNCRSNPACNELTTSHTSK